MLWDKNLGLFLVIVGVLANNYVYLRDLFLGTHDGMILIGSNSWIGIAVTLVVVVIGVFILMRPQQGSTPVWPQQGSTPE